MGAYDDRGQALFPMIGTMMFAMLLAFGMARLGRDATAQAAARSGADAAALAGAVDGRNAARAFAAENGGELVGFAEVGGDIEVGVLVDGAEAVARARHTPPPTGGPGREGLQPAMLAALSRADALLGRPVPITSGYRSTERQAVLWANRHNNPYPVAPPGTSRHESGLAVDVPLVFVETLREVAAQAGLCQPVPSSDPIHFEVCRWQMTR